MLERNAEMRKNRVGRSTRSRGSRLKAILVMKGRQRIGVSDESVDRSRRGEVVTSGLFRVTPKNKPRARRHKAI